MKLLQCVKNIGQTKGNEKLRQGEKKLDDFTVLVGVLSSGLIAVNLYVIKSLSNLCDRISHLEGKLSRK